MRYMCRQLIYFLFTHDVRGIGQRELPLINRVPDARANRVGLECERKSKVNERRVPLAENIDLLIFLFRLIASKRFSSRSRRRAFSGNQ